MKRDLYITDEVHLVHETLFAVAAAAMQGGDFLVRLGLAIDHHGEHDGKFTGNDIKQARAKPWLAPSLSRLIVRFESQWSSNMQRWDEMDDLMMREWHIERERGVKRGWWNEVAGKVEGFPENPVVHHIHPFGWIDNFIPSLDSRISRAIQGLLEALAIGEARSYESYNSGTDRYDKILVSKAKPPKGTVTGKTINEIIATESFSPDNPARIFASGRYQTIINTLKEAKLKLKLSGDELYDEAMQDRVFSEYLIYKAGQGALAAFIFERRGTIDDAMYAASKEWASIAAPMGRHLSKRYGGHVSDGTQSYYENGRSGANHASSEATNRLRCALKELLR